jgi:hypothetical protein
MDNVSRRLQLDIRSVDQEVQFWGKRAGHATTVVMATTRTTKQTRNHQSKLQRPVNIVHWTPMDNVSGRLQLDIRSADQELQFWEKPLSEMKILPMGRRQGNKGPTCRNKLQGPVSIDLWYPKVNANRWLQLDIRSVTRERLFLVSVFSQKSGYRQRGWRQGNQGPTCRNKLQGPVSIDL